MAAPTVKIQRDDDGGASLVADVDGVAVVFSTVNPSALAELAKAQGKSIELPQPETAEGSEG